MTSSARIDELRKKFDENPRRYFAPLANEYRKAGDFDQAIFICQEYLPQQPGHMSGHIVFGQALFEAKRLPEARTVFETALTLDPENLIALRHLADISRELGEITVARGWYERVLQADPRNEEIAAIMSSMSAPRAAAAPTANVPTVQPAVASKPAATPPAPPSATAPTVVEMSTAAVQEMVRARQAAKAEATPAKTLDEAPTVELIVPPPAATMEGLEPTSQAESAGASSGGMLDIPSGGLLDSAEETPSTFDIPTGGMLGLEPTAAAPTTPEAVPEIAPAVRLDLAIEGFAPRPPAPPPTPAPAAASGGSDGLLDLESFEIGGATGAAATAPVAASPTAASAPIDGGHEGTIDFDFELPAAPAAPAAAPPPAGSSLDSTPTDVINAIKNAAAVVMDVVEEAVPAVMDLAEQAVPAVVDAVTSAPTMIMDAIRVDAPKTGALKPAAAAPLAPTQPMDVGSVTEEMNASRSAKPAELPADRVAPAFVTETMAQLYLDQGHRAEAIDIYRQLVAAKPNDAELRVRLDAIERGAEPRTPALDRAPPKGAPTITSRRFSTSGPSIRDVLRDLFGIDGAVAAHDNASENGSVAGEMGSIDVLFSAASMSDELIPLAAAFDGGYVAPNGTIDEVFAGGGR